MGGRLDRLGDRPLPDPGTLVRKLREEYGLPDSDELFRRVKTWAVTGNPQLEQYIRRCLASLRKHRDELRFVGDKVPPRDILARGIPLLAVPSLPNRTLSLVMFDPDRLTLHTIVVGLPGTGKTTLVRGLLRLLSKLCPWVRIIVFDPNRSYLDVCTWPDWLAARLLDLCLNPFAPPDRYALDAWLSETLDVLCLDELKHSRYLLQCRIDWLFALARSREARGEPFCYPSLVDLRNNLAAKRERPGSVMERYREAALNVIEGRVRTCATLYDCARGMEPFLSNTRARIATEGIGNVANMEFLFSHLIHFVAARRSLEPLEMPPSLHTLIVLEEAQMLLQPRAEGISFYQNMMLRMRALGVGILFVSQDLSRIDPLIVAACGNIFAFAQSSRGNKRAVQATLDLSPRETGLLGELPPGVVFARMAGHREWPYPFVAHVPMED